jgi:hypothetical protein
MKLRLLILVAILLAGLGLGSHRTQATTTPSVNPADLRVLKSASLQLKNRPLTKVIYWLRGREIVGSAAIGRDGKTADILFRDGFHADIVPRGSGVVRFPAAQLRPSVRPHQPAGAQAAVLLPFASETGGPNEGDVEITDLRNAGFQMGPPAVNTQVTIQLLEGLAQYNAIYMLTHSGVDSAGHAIVVSGQLWVAGDNSMAALQSDGSVVASEVFGSSQLYWAITSAFVRQHMGQFAANALLFLNGCAVAGTDFWSAGLAAKGVGALLSWDADAQVPDEYFTAAAFFYYMNQGQTVAAALSATRNAGLGTSQYFGKTANLKLDGSGGITLQLAAAGGSSNPTPTNTPPPLPPPPLPTATFTPVSSHPVPTSTATTVPPKPTSTSTLIPPTATSTPAPPQLSLVPLVKPGDKQQITASGFAANEGVEFVVTFPNGDLLGQRDTAGVEGTAQFSFTQPGSKITRDSNIAAVSVAPQTAVVGRAMPSARPGSASAQYAIGFGKIDVSVQPRQVGSGQKVAIFVHTQPHMKVAATIRAPALKTLRGKTGAQGWCRLTYRVPAGVKSGETLVVRAWVTLAGHLTQAKTPLKVK